MMLVISDLTLLDTGAMTTKHSTAPAPTDTRPLWRQVADTRRDAFVIGGAAVVIAGGAGALAFVMATPYPLLLWIVALVAGVYARHLDAYAQRAAEALPAKPPRTRPHWLRRLWWWFARRQVQRAARPKPWRGVKVGAVEDAVKLPRQPQEMAQAAEPAIVHGYTASDVYFIASRAATYGLGERATDAYNRRVWTWDDSNKISLPSGKHLTRTGFRAVQDWLVGRKLAVSQPAYQLTVTPEVVLSELEKC